MTLDQALRDCLAARTSELTPTAGLLGRVHATRRRRRGTRLALAGAVAVVAAIAVPYALNRPGHALPPAEPTPGPTALVPVVDSRTPFALNPTWAPPGVGQPMAFWEGPGTVLRYHAATGGVTIAVAVVFNGSPEVLDRPIGWKSVPGDVNGHPATVTYGREADAPIDGVNVTWQPAVGYWATVHTEGLTQADALRYARGLTSGRIDPYHAPAEFTVAPPGWSVSYASDTLECITGPSRASGLVEPAPSGPPGGVWQQPDGYIAVCVEVSHLDAAHYADVPQQIMLAGRRATLGRDDGGYLVIDVDLGSGHRMQISQSATAAPAISEPDLLAIAEGVVLHR